jgi:ABC-type maltose transport system permease subunit
MIFGMLRRALSFERKLIAPVALPLSDPGILHVVLSFIGPGEFIIKPVTVQSNQS